ncbi:winged helix-turn-helix domain-containing protein [Vibrio ostreicida]|nr:winged helix-turn-helix domain-containing protein [Vibrio ostreicida]NPD09641.1 tetratricopeptide repeat protein [Vibrio ostreicida]
MHFEFDTETGYLYDLSGGQRSEKRLRHKVAELLTYLIENKDRVVSKDELLSTLWRHGEYRDTSLIQSVRDLRRALGDKAQTPSYIRTYPQRGYQWIADVSPAQAELPDEQGVAYLEVADQTCPPTQKRSVPRRALVRLGAVIGMVFVMGAVVLRHVQPTIQSPTSTAVHSLMILPFSNQTGQNQFNWVELGLADMMSMVMRQTAKYDVISPSETQMLLLDGKLGASTSPEQLKQLLKRHQTDVAIEAQFRLYNQQQVLDFNIIYADGSIKQGSISYPSLPSDIYAVAEQIDLLLDPRATKRKTGGATFLQLSSESFAKGISVLEQFGALKAQRYFNAAAVLDPNDWWPKAYLGRTQLLLGDWQAAQETFEQLDAQVPPEDKVLRGLFSVWQAQLAIRFGNEQAAMSVKRAITAAERSHDNPLKSEAYRLAASVAFQSMQWQEQQHWLEKAQQIKTPSNNLNYQADRLFYLGNQANEGLEQSPMADMTENGPKLRQALNYYRQLGYLPKVADTQLAMARNYALPEQEREEALQAAVSLFRQLQQPYELAEALIYTGFFQLQYHRGYQAEQTFAEAIKLAQDLKAPKLIETAHFYQAFALLDQGLFANDGRKLTLSLQQFEQILPQLSSPLLRLSSLIFLGWGYSEQGQYQQAHRYLTQAVSDQNGTRAPTTHHYAVYSLMKLYLDHQQYHQAVALSEHEVTTRLQARYLARAHSELGHHKKAVDVLEQFSKTYPQHWTENDQWQLSHYQRRKAGRVSVLLEEPEAHSVYCEGQWNRY